MDQITLIVKAIPENESFVRSTIAAYAVRKNPDIQIINDIKTAVSEAVTNSIVHAYNDDKEKEIHINARLSDDSLIISVIDFGIGIADIEKMTSGLFTSKPELEHSGLGFTIMRAFMDELEIASDENVGTTITMTKRLI
ncbi:MAG: anti-sigma F factor [Christensenellaceae bacterium]|jgi:stage II sporulation protein AB (anti-sigma F factor)|nr:anti-sigma F factor [Christensenellaceae bacterium]